MKEEVYFQKNKQAWNSKTSLHVQSAFYDQENFLKGKNSLQSIELDLLGDVKGKKILHLQCHFGQDTLSLARMGAIVTGVDFSEEAIRIAKEMNETLKLNAQFICCNVYDTAQYLDEDFDIVFTSYGTIGWLPDLQRWSNIIQHFLKPKGMFVFVEFHPVVWMFDNDFKKIQYRYFKDAPIVEVEEGTYADKEAKVSNETISWNHSLSEVLSALFNQGLMLSSFKEFDYSPYNCFANMMAISEHRFQIQHLGNKIPMVYALTAIKG